MGPVVVVVRNKLKRVAVMVMFLCKHCFVPGKAVGSPIIATTLLRGAEDDGRGSRWWRRRLAGRRKEMEKLLLLVKGVLAL